MARAGLTAGPRSSNQRAEARGVTVELVPFSEKWAGSETKLDLKAWYRRPSVHGGFSMVGPLPLRRHLDWTRKGCEYVTLASRDDLALVAPWFRAEGVDVAKLAEAYDARGHFRMADYLKAEQVKDTQFLDDLRAKVAKFGADAVIEMMRITDPTFVLPEGLDETEPKAKRGRPAKVAEAVA